MGMGTEEQLATLAQDSTTPPSGPEAVVPGDLPSGRGADSVWVHLAIIIPLAAIIFLFRLGVADWRDAVDTHQWVMISHMMAGDGWVLPLRNRLHLPAKPPLFAWLGALWYYAEPLLTMGLPWIIALPATVAGTSLLPQRQRRFLWVWATVMFVFFSLSLGKRRVYLLPLRPALAILLAGWLVPQLARWRGRARTTLPPPVVRGVIAALVLAMLAVAVALVAGVGGWGTMPEQWSYWWRLFVREYPATIAGFALAIGLGMDQMLRALWQHRVERAAFALVLILGLGTAIAISCDAIVRGQAVSMRPLARQVAVALAPDEPLAFFETDDEEAIPLQFHLRRHIGVVRSVGGHEPCTPPAAGAYLIQENVWETQGCAGNPTWHVLARGGPEVRRHRGQRMVFARYTASPDSPP